MFVASFPSVRNAKGPFASGLAEGLAPPGRADDVPPTRRCAALPRRNCAAGHAKVAWLGATRRADA